MKIGFIGLGSLGTPIAKNLLDAGHELFVFNRTKSKTASLASAGAKVCDSVGELAKAVNIVFTIVSDDAAIEQVVNGADGLLENLAQDSLHISMSTILADTAEKLEKLHKEKGQHYLASPVFGRPEAAMAKKLNFVVSGDAKLFAQAEPLLKDAGGAGVWDFGTDIRTANTVKLCGNFLIVAALEAIGESVMLAEKAGIDAQKMWSLFNQTLFNTPVYHNYSNIILKKQFEPAAFTMQLGLKDIRLVNETAAHAGQPMPLAALLKQQMEKLVNQGKGEIDWSAVSVAAGV